MAGKFYDRDSFRGFLGALVRVCGMIGSLAILLVWPAAVNAIPEIFRLIGLYYSLLIITSVANKIERYDSKESILLKILWWIIIPFAAVVLYLSFK